MMLYIVGAIENRSYDGAIFCFGTLHNLFPRA